MGYFDDWIPLSEDEFASPYATGAIAEPVSDVVIDPRKYPPLWTMGIIDPYTRMTMYAYRAEGENPAPIEAIAVTARQIGYTDEKGEPTGAWLGAYERGMTMLEPFTTPPVDAGVVLSGIPPRHQTIEERARSDILPYIPFLAPWEETVSRAEEGNLLGDVTGLLKWTALLVGIGLVGYGVLKVLS